MKIKMCKVLAILFLASGCGYNFLDLSKAPIKYHVVNLDSASDRLELMTGQLKLANIPFTRISAVLGKGKPDSFFEALVKRGALDSATWRSRTLRPGEIGLYLTTIDSIMPTAISYGQDTLSVIFEDDVIIPIDLEHQFRQALTLVPDDFDILYLGCFQHYRSTSEGSVIGPYTPAALESSKKYDTEMCPPSSLYRVPNTPWMKMTASCTPGTWAYVVSGRSAQKIAHNLTPMSVAIDVRIGELIGKEVIVGYCLSPEIIRTNEQLPSSIREAPSN